MPDADRAMPHAIVLFQPFGRRVTVPSGATVLNAARAGGLGLLSVCGGTGCCETCRVRVIQGEVSEPSLHEREVLSDADLRAGHRLACQACVRGDLVIDVPAESIGTEQRVQLESDSSIWGDALRDLTLPARTAPGTPAFGLAVDVGTTKIAAYLVDLCSRRTVACEGEINPQVAYGEDVISRIAYADNTPDGLRTLHTVLLRSLNGLVERLCAAASTTPAAVVEAVIVGNTAMHHIACALPVAQLGRAPYAPAIAGALAPAAAEFGLDVAQGARVYLPPNIAGYVGADHVAVLLAVGPPPAGRTRLVIDIGTNTEISFLADDRIISCSCASGPAFEGAHIGCGMRAAAGAIERVRVVDGEVRCQTIGGGPAIGVCGSGVLDAVAELASHGALDRHGAFRRDHPLFVLREDKPVLVLAPSELAGHNREIVLTRGDVTEIQLAKAAIRAGIDLLLAHANIGHDGVDEVVVAGAFGTYLDLSSARRVGMLPDLPADRFRQVGNAAGAGARQMVLSSECRRNAESLAARVEYIELSGDPRFADTFAAALGFDT